MSDETEKCLTCGALLDEIGECRDCGGQSELSPAPCSARDGNWMDKWGACKVCNGEIPHGHTDNCDIYRLVNQITELRHALDGLVQECEYSASSGLPFNFPDGKGHWTQLGKARALLRLPNND